MNYIHPGNTPTPTLTPKQSGILYVIGELEQMGIEPTIKRIANNLWEAPSNEEISAIVKELTGKEL